jgi:hypothetical protein
MDLNDACEFHPALMVNEKSTARLFPSSVTGETGRIFKQFWFWM